MGRTSLTPDSSANQRRRVGPLISSAMPLAPIASPAACVPPPPPPMPATVKMYLYAVSPRIACLRLPWRHTLSPSSATTHSGGGVRDTFVMSRFPLLSPDLFFYKSVVKIKVHHLYMYSFFINITRKIVQANAWASIVSCIWDTYRSIILSG